MSESEDQLCAQCHSAVSVPFGLDWEDGDVCYQCMAQMWPDIQAEVTRLEAENKRLQAWVNDLMSQMYVNCVYCGHRYGPRDEVPASMADILKEHIEQCPEHPMSKLRRQRDEIVRRLEAMGGLIVLEAQGNPERTLTTLAGNIDDALREIEE